MNKFIFKPVIITNLRAKAVMVHFNSIYNETRQILTYVYFVIETLFH